MIRTKGDVPLKKRPEVPVVKVRELEAASPGPKPVPVSEEEAKDPKFSPFTFSLEPGLIYRVEEEMRSRKHRYRSETIRVLLREALDGRAR